MEKLKQILNITMLEHLPGIYNMMTIFNMLLFGFLVSQPVFCLMAIDSIQKSLGVSRKLNLVQAKRKLLKSFYPGHFTFIALIILLARILNDFTGLGLVVTAFSLVLLVITYRVYLTSQLYEPANRRPGY